MTLRTQRHDGELWFTAKYAATLLGTSRKKVEAMAIRELIRARPDGISFLIAECEVTQLRRDPSALSALKKAVVLPRAAKYPEWMPSETVYKDDAIPSTLSVCGRIGHPLKDPRI